MRSNHQNRRVELWKESIIFSMQFTGLDLVSARSDSCWYFLLWKKLGFFFGKCKYFCLNSLIDYHYKWNKIWKLNSRHHCIYYLLSYLFRWIKGFNRFNKGTQFLQRNRCNIWKVSEIWWKMLSDWYSESRVLMKEHN